MASIILPVRVKRRPQGPADKHAGELGRAAFIRRHKQCNQYDTFFKGGRGWQHTGAWTVKFRPWTELKWHVGALRRTAYCLFVPSLLLLFSVKMSHSRCLFSCIPGELERFIFSSCCLLSGIPFLSALCLPFVKI